MKQTPVPKSKADLRKLFTGYTEARETRADAMGETGLTLRVRNLNYLHMFLSILDEPALICMFSRQSPFLQEMMRVACHCTFITEFLRVMDRAATDGRENLTVELCHEYFQQCAGLPGGAKADEGRLFQKLSRRYGDDRIPKFRNRLYFHLDKKATCTDPPSSRSSRCDMMRLLLEWFEHAYTSVYGKPPRAVTVGAAEAANLAGRDLRRILGSAGMDRGGKAETPEEWFRRAVGSGKA